MTAGRAVLLYDGECGVCAGSVQWLLRYEPTERAALLHFAPLQGTFGAEVRAMFPQVASADSVVWYERRPDGTADVRLRSDATLRAMQHLGGAWRVAAAILRLVPRPLRDAMYDAIAARRLSLAAPRCLLPSPAQRQRFLP